MEDQEYLTLLGEKVYLLRKAAGIQQNELAERIESTNTQVRRIERGQVNSSILMLRKIAKELGVPLGEIVDFKS